ncbi:MAG TPA: bifunctional diaminohydroxyphosphoribosylaminopyrimidine deaminase/5-amino-6-(5-phosphoribosylamino)uracil reductase RibD [Bacteroidales bacterium]|nr:bifunctional diaminohydroxyphosphoribosylaminopyrimidine deaminase/5-amino-6-(5-phosphoribosylamino)uracil reductase RibD [Bacteroidales bacterium]
MINRTIHEKYMQRCLDLAKLGAGNTSPNPMVGSAIVYNGKIIGEGYHRKSGEPHAEVNAINSVKDKNLLSKASLYVNLEPCAHYGKTPPCANLIATLKIPNVIIGTVDTAAHVSGRGIQILKEAGCNVVSGVMESESRDLNKRFFTFHEKKRPYIILKWAQTKDGFIDVIRNNGGSVEPTWITNEYAKTLVHKWRSEEQSILIGTNTALADNPSLTTRLWKGKNPIRIVFDRNLRLPPNLHVFDDIAKTIVIADESTNLGRIKFFNENIGIKFVNYEKDFYSQLFQILINEDIQSVIIEGGEQVLNSFIENDLWDEARIFYGEKEFKKGIQAPRIEQEYLYNDYLGNSKLTFIKKRDIFNQ